MPLFFNKPCSGGGFEKKVRKSGELPSGRAAGQPIDITYSFDKNGMMHCRIEDIGTGKSVEKENIISIS